MPCWTRDLGLLLKLSIFGCPCRGNPKIIDVLRCIMAEERHTAPANTLSYLIVPVFGSDQQMLFRWNRSPFVTHGQFIAIERQTIFEFTRHAINCERQRLSFNTGNFSRQRTGGERLVERGRTRLKDGSNRKYYWNQRHEAQHTQAKFTC